MRMTTLKLMTIAATFVAIALPTSIASAGGNAAKGHMKTNVELGPRPFYLVDKMSNGKLKRQLKNCARKKFRKSKFSIGHRGAPLQFPEHTRESYIAAARMGAGILECDVTFTRDAQLVCRHAQCDLHTTTNILATPLAAKCTKGFTPATFNADGTLATPASAKCCASDITLAEFKTLEGKMDASDRRATTVEEYLGGTADFRTDLYATGGTLMSHKESIRLFKQLGVSMTPELKGVDGEIGFDGVDLDQERYARKMIRQYVRANVHPKDVWPQSFNYQDVKQWINEFPEIRRQAVYLVSADGTGNAIDATTAEPVPANALKGLREDGLHVIAPPMPVLLTVNGKNAIAPSRWAKKAKRAGLKMISWTTERSGRINEDAIRADGSGTFYYSTTSRALKNDGDILTTIDVLARKVGIIGLFSDWPATTTYYANCMGLK